jgi:hypothetical protein
MAKVFSQRDRKWVEVKNLKNLTFESHPGYEFFVHRTIEDHGVGFTVTEKTSGCAVVHSNGKMEDVVIKAKERLNEVSPEFLKDAVKRAIEKREELLSQMIVCEKIAEAAAQLTCSATAIIDKLRGKIQ